MKIIKITPNLYDIRLELPGTNFTSILSSWVYKDDRLCFLVDTGPTSSIGSLKQALDELGIKKNDLQYIFLSHIHMDHAGGVGELIKSFPNAQVICHPKGIKHLINPEKLWEGSIKILGEVAKLYGKINPVPEERIIYRKYFADEKIKVIDTSGHAPHHLSYLFDNIIFVGEAAGVNIPIENGIFTRPATPPVFSYESTISSVKKLLAEDLSRHMICYAHHGAKENAVKFLNIAIEQVNLWIQIIDELFEKREAQNFFEQVIQELIDRDKYFSSVNTMNENSRKKELFFISNSIRGIVDYLERMKK
ncbi:MAG: MBL fold metallo-hydrolase [Promethearchaeota archaeon]|jgi:glyoxylase-like metal-dependent hydrolase (beta-lactamase superfamily II)